MTSQKPREIAVRVLRQHSGGTDYIENLLGQALAPGRLSNDDRRLCQELVYGAVRWQSTLDWLIERKTDGRAQPTNLQLLLRLGLYQLFWLDRIPDHAAINETVDLARLLGFDVHSGFVNAILRGYARERAETETLLRELKSSDPARGWSHPRWLVDRWQTRWGPESTANLMEWDNTPPRTFARVNTLRTQAAKLLEQWREENVEYDFRRWDWIGENAVFELKSHPPLERLGSFRLGLFYVQDPSTLLAVKELEPQSGMTVLDLCAAPGGKTTHIAQRMNNQGRVVATDNSPDRLERLRQNCTRMHATCVEVQAANAAPPAQAALAFDRVLIDAPCSNTGVMRRRVDLRWRLRPEEFERLAVVQAALLDQAAPQLKPGGILIYSTCSLEPEENTQGVQRFLALHPEFLLERERELLPFRDGTDGAYVARLRKRSG